MTTESTPNEQNNAEARDLESQERLHSEFGMLIPGKLARWVISPEQNYQDIIEGATYDDYTGERSINPGRALEADPEDIERVKAELLKVPLFHATPNPFDGDIQPNTGLDSSSNTYTLDRSLGLDECTFAYWGPYSTGRYGNSGYLIDPALLLEERTFVTPRDILALVSQVSPLDVDQLGSIAHKGSYESLEEGDFESVTGEYIKKVVSGRDWLDITARTVLNGGTEKLWTEHGIKLDGEIKVLGAIPRSSIIGEVRTQEDFDTLVQETKTTIEQACGKTISYYEAPEDPWFKYGGPLTED